MKFYQLFFSVFISVAVTAQKPFTGENAVVKSEFVYKAEDVKFPSCHASTIAETKNGLIAAWFGGTHEKNPDVGIWVSRFRKRKMDNSGGSGQRNSAQNAAIPNVEPGVV
jgi:predicted neuraminidase